MGIRREIPRSDEGRDLALTAGKNRKDTVAPADMAITPATILRLDTIQPNFKAKMLARGVALSAQSGSTSGVDLAKAASKMFTSHFIQVFNLGVTRSVYPKADRAYYQLDVNSEAVPSMGTEQEILLWGERIKPGDLARVAAGGAAMSNPTQLEVNTKVLDFKTKNTDQSNKKTAYDHAQENVEALHEEADKVIKKVWDEVETFYNEETPASKRRKSREWGVVYVSDIKLTFNFVLKDSVSNNPIAAVQCLLTETNNSVLTDALGKATMESNISDSATFSFRHADYVTQDIVVDLTSGEVVFEVPVALLHI